tara:strand:+ start:300 stop:509 length:210 start_codon:yes stop_codon:yes gene_type:complete
MKLIRVFKYELKIRETGKVLVEQEIVFGSTKNPLPEDWKNDPWVQVGIQEHKEKMINEFIEVTVKEIEE